MFAIPYSMEIFCFGQNCWLGSEHHCSYCRYHLRHALPVVLDGMGLSAIYVGHWRQNYWEGCNSPVSVVVRAVGLSFGGKVEGRGVDLKRLVQEAMVRLK